MPRLSPFYALAALLFCAPRAQSAPSASPRGFSLAGFTKAGASTKRVRVLPPVALNKSASTSRTIAADGSLRFEYIGFTSGQKEVLSQFVSKNYPFMVARYGLPAPEQRANGGKTITVVGDDVELPSSDPNKALQGANAYRPVLSPDNSPRGNGGTIFFPYDSNFNQQTNQFNFTQLVLRAFQGPNQFSYDYNAGRYIDTYQAGLADAVALLVLYDSLSADAKKSFDPADYYGFYSLALYDILNRPELSSAYILPPTDNFDSLMPDFRLGMAQAAWLKVGIEKPTFFSEFNARFYQRVPARTAVSPNTLRALAAEVAPTVEGLGFQDWARRQHILNVSVTTGTKIYPIILPNPIPASGNRQSAFAGYAEAFTTQPNGDEIKLRGYGRLDLLDENGESLDYQLGKPGDSHLLDLQGVRKEDINGNQIPDFPIGISALPAPDRARVTVKLSFKGAETTAPFPSIGAVGNGASQTTIYGISETGRSGDVAISNSAGNEVAPFSRGAFVGTQKAPSAPSVVTSLTLGGRVFKRNTAWVPSGSRGVAFVLDGGTANQAFTLKTASGASRVRMISLPLFPAQSDEAAILGIAAKDLKLARYRSNLSPATLSGNALTFGINGDRHELYPNISTPMAPGRGYWLGIGEITRTIQGSEPRTDQEFEIPLSGGWNQFGVPFNKAFPPSAIRVKYGSFAPVSYAEAVRNGLISPGIWRWQGRGGYARADSAADATLPPFEGFYIYAIPARGVSLVFNSGTTTARTAAAAPSGWNVPLIASTNSARDASNRFGIANGSAAGLAAANPPTGPPVVTLRFASSGDALVDQTGAGAASGWADSFLPTLGREGKWDFTVDGTTKGETVALSWGDLKSVPAGVGLTLRDEKTGRNLALRAGGSHKWTGDGAPRRFSIRAFRAARASLKIAAAPSRGVEITVGMDMTAHGRLEIQNLAGDMILVLKTGDFSPKTPKFTWRGATTSGQNAAPGRYRAVWTPTLSGDLGAAVEFALRP